MNLKLIGDGPLFALREVAPAGRVLRSRPVAHPTENQPDAYCQVITADYTICGEELLESGACPKGHKP